MASNNTYHSIVTSKNPVMKIFRENRNAAKPEDGNVNTCETSFKELKHGENLKGPLVK